MGYRVAFTTLGCKTNHYDTAEIIGCLDRSVFDIVPFNEIADAYVVNSCTVTSVAGRQSRQFAHRARRKNPNSLVILTGCYASMSAEEREKMPDVDYILGKFDKKRVEEVLIDAAKETGYYPKITEKIPYFSTQSRPYLRVQDGCEASCSYCIIPKVRGKIVSDPIDDVLKRLEMIAKTGVKEVVLTGIHIGQWGKDIHGHSDFSALLKAIDDSKLVPRIRLSSLEPLELTDQVIDIIKNSDTICPHIHIPLQSGSDEILEAMNRPYKTRHYKERIERANAEIENLSIGIDVIVGFPGESEDDVANTYSFLKSLPFHYLHVFPYSERPGTPAANMPNQIQSNVKKERSKALIELGLQRRIDSAKLHVNKYLQVLIEEKQDRETGMWQGFSDNYQSVLLKSTENLSGKIVSVKATSMYNTTYKILGSDFKIIEG